MKAYQINEMFYSLQGEGARAGSANVFIRFSGCNLECRADPGDKSPGGFDCDTEFASGRKLTGVEIRDAVMAMMPAPRAVILTGGEPLLQVDPELIAVFEREQIYIALETNGSLKIPPRIDWISVSPKVAEHALQVEMADELRYVRHHGQGIPKPKIRATRKYISPAWATGEGFGRNLEWCMKLVKENPEWSLSIQQHKVWGVR